VPVLDAEVGQIVVSSRQTVAVVEHPDPRVSGRLLRLLRANGAQALLGLPIQAGDAMFATFYVFAAEGASLSDEKQRLLAALAGRASLAIENAQLFEASRGKAALEERQRLARELHDSVSQALYGIALNAGAARMARTLDGSQLEHLLDEVSALAEAGLAEMRALIFELRPESLQQEGLVKALEKQAAAARARHGLDVRARFEREPEVPLPVKEALYRIVQEAVQNSAKHARATVVEIALRVGDGLLILTVGDDGQGFDPSGSFPGHLGLRSMQERAEAINGCVTVESAPGSGTRISVRVPAVTDARGPS
jgi:signal transduction histidine kinase